MPAAASNWANSVSVPPRRSTRASEIRTDIKGIATPASDYELHVAQEGNRWVFDFRDKNGRTGTLTCPCRTPSPSSRSIRASMHARVGRVPPSTRNGVVSAKAAGTGIFAAGVRGNTRASLILHGHGNSCTGPEHFGHWTLEVKGPNADFSLIGELVR